MLSNKVLHKTVQDIKRIAGLTVLSGIGRAPVYVMI